MQDIANAITAAAGATGKMDETKQKAAELAIGESIKKTKRYLLPNQKIKTKMQ